MKRKALKLIFQKSLESNIITLSHIFFYQNLSIMGKNPTAQIIRILIKITSAAYDYLTIKQREAYSWGFGMNGQLGLGYQSNMPLPQLIKDIVFVNIAAKKSMSAGLTKNGKAYVWGRNRNGVLGHNPPDLNLLLPKQISLNKKIDQLSCGYRHLAVLTKNGQIYVWGLDQKNDQNEEIQVGRKAISKKPFKVNISNVTQISCSGDYLSFVTSRGKVYLMGMSKIIGLDNKLAKSATDIIELNIQRIKRVQSGLNFSLGLDYQGKVYVWGSNNFGQLGIGSLENLKMPQKLQFEQKIVSISCGDYFSAAVTQDGSVYTWGSGKYGQLGHGQKSDELLPRKITNIVNQKIKDISCGQGHTAFLAQTGKLFVVGRQREGQLGRQQKVQGVQDYSLQIKQVEGLPKDAKVNKVACGANHTIVLLE